MRTLAFVFSILLLPRFAWAQELITLNLWEQDPPAIAEEIDKWIKVFEKSHPQIKIVRQHYENEELRRKFLRSAMTGDGADIIYGPNDIAGVFSEAGVIRPVNNLLRRPAYSNRALDMTRIESRIWGVPLSEGAHLLLYYRKSRVAKVPKTTAELIEQSRSFTDARQNRYGLAYFQSEPFWFVPFLSAFGGWPLGRRGELHEVTLNTPETRKALQYVLDLRNKWKIIPQNCDFDCAKSMFLADRALFHISGDWELANFQSKLGDDLGIAPLPLLTETGQPLKSMMGGRFIYINRQVEGKKLSAVKSFLDFLGTDAIQRRIALQLISIPAHLSVRSEKPIQSMAVLQQSMAAAAQSRPMPPQVEMRAAWDGMRIMIQRAVSGTESVDEAVQTGQKAANEALQSLRKPGPGKSDKAAG